MSYIYDKNDGYYHLYEDIEKYEPLGCWCYVVYSKRGPGKTYSALWESIRNNERVIYCKRTVEDTELICSANLSLDFDPSPYAPINRDKGTLIQPKAIKKGLGGFWNCNEDGVPEGSPVAYLLALSTARRFKGFSMPFETMLLDEFIPQIGERVINRQEGELILDLLQTINRDRQKRGLRQTRLVLFANAEEISTGITNTLMITDAMAELNASGESHLFIEDRGILIHHITDDEVPVQEAEKEGIYKAMIGSSWWAKSFGGQFANNDFSCIKTMSIKKMRPYCHLHYKQFDYYIYIRDRDGYYYMSYSRNNKSQFDFDLNTENHQKKFNYELREPLVTACINGRFSFQKYSMYDLIINYKKFFKL